MFIDYLSLSTRSLLLLSNDKGASDRNHMLYSGLKSSIAGI